MKSTEEWKDFFAKVIDPVDKKDPEQCRSAFEKCIQYANKNLRKSFEYNVFIAEAAEHLGQELLHLDVMKFMVEVDDNARLNLVYEEGMGPVLTGNSEGLSYLSERQHTSKS